MNVTRRTFVGGTSAAMLALLSGCGKQESESTATTNESTGAAETSLAFDSAAWRYDADDDVYYQLGVSYCETPADDDYERLAILVPGAYMSATDNGDGTYTCEVDATGKVGAYTATTAPVAMPVNTPHAMGTEVLACGSAQMPWGRRCWHVAAHRTTVRAITV